MTDISEFQYLMKLHYSQTKSRGLINRLLFQYLMKLHYSQTIAPNRTIRLRFQYLMKLHYSQTACLWVTFSVMVSVPYEITLLSNIF